MIKGDTGLEDVASEGRVKSSVLLGSLRGDHPRRLGLRDATLDGGNGERCSRVRASRVKNDFMVSEQFLFFHKNSFVFKKFWKYLESYLKTSLLKLFFSSRILS